MTKKTIKLNPILLSAGSSGVPPEIRLSYAQISKNIPLYARAAEALEKKGVVYESPAWRGGATAHFFVPKLKVAIWFSNRKPHQDAAVKGKWAEEGCGVLIFPSAFFKTLIEDPRFDEYLVDAIEQLSPVR